jgi:SAM-dependent methyltransferase
MMVDFGRTAQDYAAHRAGFPDALFDRLAEWGVGSPGQRAVDLGSGTGSLARGLARRGCTVVGLDPAGPMLAMARALDDDAGVRVDYVVGRAEAAGLGTGAFATVTAGQCWHWFDRPRAAAECRRLLAPGGALAICHFDWLPWPGTAVEATEQLILRHNPGWRFAGGTGMYPGWSVDVAGAGLGAIETFSFDVEVAYSHEDWRGRVRASAGVATTLGPDAVAAFDTDHAALLAERFPADPIAVPHRVWALVARKDA